MDNVQAYNAQSDSIDVDDITSDICNRAILRRLRRNEQVSASYHKTLFIQNEHEDDEDEDCIDYCPEGADDMGWLGYFIGQNDHLEHLVIETFIPSSSGSNVRDVLRPFFRGVSSNKSIRQISFRSADLLGGDMFTMLTQFFQNSNNLININVNHCVWGDDGARLFALTLGSITHKSLKKVELEDNNIEEDGMVDIITALSMHPNLSYLDLGGNRLNKNGCVALKTLLRCSANQLQYLYLSNTDINDEGIEALVPILATCSHLKRLNLSNNTSITTRGWQRSAAVLEAPNSNLQELYIRQNNVDDEAAAAFAKAIANNHTLKAIYSGSNPSITAKGWEAFSKVLCNTSSINATFLSNHTLRSVGNLAMLILI